MYAHLFNSRSQRGAVDLVLTETPSLVGAKIHSTYPNKLAAKKAAKELGATPYNY
jgi:hypothetical protein